jgi:hypothetical protein
MPVERCYFVSSAMDSDMPRMTLEQPRAFIAITERQRMARGAAPLNMSLSALSWLEGR